MTGQIRLLHGEEWVGLSLGGLAAAVAGAVCVEYADRAGAVTQEVILPEQIPRLIQSG